MTSKELDQRVLDELLDLHRQGWDDFFDRILQIARPSRSNFDESKRYFNAVMEITGTES